MREPTPTSQQGLQTGPEAAPSHPTPQHTWERAIQTVVDDTPAVVDNVYHRIAGEHPPGMAHQATRADQLNYWRGELYDHGARPAADPAKLAELYMSAPQDEVKDLIAALRKWARDNEVDAPDEPPPPVTGGQPGGNAARPQANPYSYPSGHLR